MSPTSIGIYGGGPLFTGGQAVIDDLRASGMTTVVAWSVHVEQNGDLIYNDPPALVSGGEFNTATYSAWPQRLASLKEAPTSVTRLLFSVGAGGTNDFHNIQALIKDGWGPDNVLYKNFAALKSAIPTIDAIDFDDEDLMDKDTTVAFGQMLHEIGYEVTFCPYYDPQYWAECLKAIDQTAPGAVTAFNLQCYSGGSGNEPEPWIEAIQSAMGPSFDAKGLVLPGLWCTNGPQCGEGQTPASVSSTLEGWKSSGIQGAWIWLLDDVLRCGGPEGTKAYAEAIRAGLS